MLSGREAETGELRRRIHELELKLISVGGLAERNEIWRQGLEQRHEIWRSTFLDMLVIVTTVITFLAIVIASRL
jgi:hypothetical protein